MYKNIVMIDFYRFFIEKNTPRSVFFSLVWRPVFPPNLIWTSLILWPVCSVTLAYPSTSHPAFQTSRTFPFLTQFQMICPSPKLRKMFRNILSFTVRNYWPVAQPPSWKTTRCLLGYQCIHCDHPYLETVSSVRNIRTRFAAVIRPTYGQSVYSYVISLKHTFLFSSCISPHDLFP